MAGGTYHPEAEGVYGTIHAAFHHHQTTIIIFFIPINAVLAEPYRTDLDDQLRHGLSSRHGAENVCGKAK